ncbi:unnamed protein product [Paramecium sonneborni]|uniref:Uncharacterized protein n=1 Tax=Paramecium sonneborni TaxID=65129 RepID=A0A8S1R156_9CILI|nr:unnamed protein product [Paramecium sonneborni]
MDFNNNANSNIPSLKKFECSYQRYGNPSDELQVKSESDSFELKQTNIQYPIYPYMFYPSTPIFPIIGEIKNEYVDQTNYLMMHGVQNGLANRIQQENRIHNEFLTNQTTYGCKKVCQIDCMLIERYFKQKYWIFKNANQKYKIDQKKWENSGWLKARLQHRYKSQIYDTFVEMIDQIQQEGELKMNARTQAIQLQNKKGFENLERQIQKVVKSQKKFDIFLLEIQKVLAEFIFSSLN